MFNVNLQLSGCLLSPHEAETVFMSTFFREANREEDVNNNEEGVISLLNVGRNLQDKSQNISVTLWEFPVDTSGQSFRVGENSQ